MYEHLSKELSKQEYGGVKLAECEKSTDKIECKSLRKGNICVNTNEDDIMSRKSYRPAEYAAKYSVENKKLPPFRAGKYIPKMMCILVAHAFRMRKLLLCLQNQRKAQTNWCLVSGTPPPFRTGKYTPNDSGIYVKSADKFPSSSASPTQGLQNTKEENSLLRE